MKLSGGYTPRIAGRPTSTVEEVPLPPLLRVPLSRHGAAYAAVAAEGDNVKLGTALGEARLDSGVLYIPSPAAGRVESVAPAENGRPAEVSIAAAGEGIDEAFSASTPDRIPAEAVREALARAGVWPFFWSSATGGLPPLDGSERPRAVIVNCLSAEPFLARGNVVLDRAWGRVVNGIKFLQRLLDDYGTVELVLTHKRHPLAQKLYRELAGDALLHFHPVPLVYPVENPRLIRSALVRSDSAVTREHVVWVIDIQGIAALGACLSEGLPPQRRLVAVGGPGVPEPRHLDVPIGTPLTCLPPPGESSVRILRGGLLTGEPMDPASETLNAGDTGFFYLPDRSKRDFIGFVNPGFDRTSIMPCFATRLTGGADRHVSTSMRGEPRPCIACGLCERVCPAGLLPQVLHRYLYAGKIDEAETTGLELCLDCGLCTYVCPSKIELLEQFDEAREQIRRERAEIEASALEADGTPDGGAWGGPLA